MIQDIHPAKLKNEYDKDAVATDRDIVLVFQDSQVMYREKDGEIIFPTVGQIGINYDYIYLFAVDDERYFLLSDKNISLEGFDYKSVREIRKMGVGPRDRIFALYTGVHLRD